MKKLAVFLITVFASLLITGAAFAEKETKVTGFYKTSDGVYYYVNGVKQVNKTDVVKGTVGGKLAWWHVVGGKVTYDTTLVKHSGKYYAVFNGKIDFKANTIVKYNNYWRPVINGVYDPNFDGFLKYSNYWWYCKSGRMQYTLTGAKKYKIDGLLAFYYFKNGKHLKTDAVVEYGGKNWIVVGGYIRTKFTGFRKIDGVWYYFENGVTVSGNRKLVKATIDKTTAYWFVKDGKINYDTTMVKYGNYYYYVTGGKVNYVDTLCYYNSKYRVIINGKYITSYEGFMKYGKSHWYCKIGVCQKEFSGVIKGIVNGETAYWSVSLGKVMGKAYLGKTIGTVNMRSGAGTDNGIVGTVETNVIFDILDQKDVDKVTWYKLKHDGKTGWISGTYVLLISVDVYEEDTTASYAATVKTKSSVNLRQGPGTSYKSLGTVSSGTTVTMIGTQVVGKEKWYHVCNGDKVGYIRNDYLTVVTKFNSASTTDAAFEAELNKQGFPESYKRCLRLLHSKYPNWKFVADKTPEEWGVVVSEHYLFGSMLPANWSGTKATSILDGSMYDSWKSKDPEAYNSNTGKYITGWDGGSWVIPAKETVRYFLDPRNFLDEVGIFQFLRSDYNITQSASSITKAANSLGVSYLGMNYTHATDKTTINYPSVLANAGKNYNINPLLLACILKQELGVTTTAVTRNQISGIAPGYEGYYNYFNIGAYTDGTYKTAWSRALAVAKGDIALSGGTFFVPWKTRTKALNGGAEYFAKKYSKANQDSLYYMKFNVKNGSNMHEFSTDIMWASTIGKELSSAYTKELRSSMQFTFSIPVYSEMSANPCKMP